MAATGNGLARNAAAPVAVDDTLTTEYETDHIINSALLFGEDGTGGENDSDADSPRFASIEITLLPRYGTLLLSGSEVVEGQEVSINDLNHDRLIFRPEPWFSGRTLFAYTVSDGHSSSHQAQVFITVEASEQQRDQDDFSDDLETSGRALINDTVHGTIEMAEDIDWFRVDLQQGESYQVDLQASEDLSQALLDTRLLGIYNDQGELQPNSSNDDFEGSAESRVMFEPSQDGRYYIAAAGFGTNTGEYRLTVTGPEPDDDSTTDPEPEPEPEVTDDFGADTATSGSLDVGARVSGKIDAAGDRDWFAVQLQQGERYQIDLQGSNAADGRLTDPYLYGIYLSDDQLLPGTSNDDHTGLDSQLTFTAQNSGLHYIAAGGFSDHTGHYQLSVQKEQSDETTTDDYGANSQQAGQIRPGERVSAQIERAGDTDWFSVQLQAGTSYRIRQLTDDSAGQGLMDTLIRGVYDDQERRLPGSRNDDFEGLQSQVVLSVPESGQYYIEAAAFGRYTGQYQLMVDADTTLETGDDIGQQPSAAAELTLDDDRGAVSGLIDFASDRDWYAVQVQSGETYQIDLQRDQGARPLADPVLGGIYDQQGQLLAGTSNDDFHGLDSRVEWTPTESGRYYIEAAGYGAHSGHYQLQIQRTSVGPTEQQQPDATLQPGSVYQGDITVTGEVDLIQVLLQEGQLYRIAQQGGDSAADQLLDPMIAGVYDPQGRMIEGSSNDDYDGLNPQVLLTPDSSGNYLIAASAFGQNTGEYQLTVESVPDASDLLSDDQSVDNLLGASDTTLAYRSYGAGSRASDPVDAHHALDQLAYDDVDLF